MSRPSSISTASWIWLFSALFTTFTIANVVAATNVMAVLSGIMVDEDPELAMEVISGVGWVMAAVLAVIMVVQVVAAVKLRDGARWARVLLTVAAACSLLAVLYDLTLWSAWLVLAANVVAVVLAYGDAATDYLEVRADQLVDA